MAQIGNQIIGSAIIGGSGAASSAPPVNADVSQLAVEILTQGARARAAQVPIEVLSQGGAARSAQFYIEVLRPYVNQAQPPSLFYILT